ncbi:MULTISPECIES: hypothetical protein [Streptomyces]|uniref:Uncharacterized protein n=1 Tax=Streptomyces spinosisporus TaxID=2927582 RepID=A0ABS9XYA4_9ACTN|nr:MULTISPECIES: hypothetical protein [Streptomyces]MCI3246577.1 hypothetical protein [Streptomyces spinosisporus]WUB37599.1 hypothetical protein OHN38_22855 [Streptomyces sp. NBC_00588]
MDTFTGSAPNLFFGVRVTCQVLSRVVAMAKGSGRRPKVDLDSGIEDVTLSLLEWLGEQGVGAMIRVDAERMRDNRPAWTFAASGEALNGGVRADGASAAECMGRAVLALREAGLVVPF